MTDIDKTLAALEAAISKKKDEDYAATHRFHAGKAVKEADISAREKKLGVRFPPSYRDVLLKHGLFTLGKAGAKHDQLVFKVWPLAQHRTGLAEYAAQLECDPTADAVAEEIGMEADVVAALGEVVLIGVEGHEDFVGFDRRTADKKTGECDFTLVLFDDTEIEALSESKTAACKNRGFDRWLAKHIARRA